MPPPEDDKPIFLIGLMGSGKTTLGRQLAAALGRQFIDLDEQLEQCLGEAIGTYMMREGEPAFRQQEHGCFARFCGSLAVCQRPAVVACGGGLPCYYNHIFSMNAVGHTLWLDVPVAVLAQRLFPHKAHRPLLADAQTEEHLVSRLHNLSTERLACYAQARYRVAGGNLRVEDLLAALPSACRKV